MIGSGWVEWVLSSLGWLGIGASLFWTAAVVRLVISDWLDERRADRDQLLVSTLVTVGEDDEDPILPVVTYQTPGGQTYDVGEGFSRVACLEAIVDHLTFKTAVLERHLMEQKHGLLAHYDDGGRHYPLPGSEVAGVSGKKRSEGKLA